jgi:hypothetical protein
VRIAALPLLEYSKARVRLADARTDAIKSDAGTPAAML